MPKLRRRCTSRNATRNRSTWQKQICKRKWTRTRLMLITCCKEARSMRTSVKNVQLNAKPSNKRRTSALSLRRFLLFHNLKTMKEQVQKQRKESTTNGNNSTMLLSARLWKTRQIKQLSRLSGKRANRSANLPLKSTTSTSLEAKKQKSNQHRPASREEINLST